MYAEFSFLEYSYNPKTISEETITTILENLGFLLYSKHTRGRVSLWSQGICLLFLRQSEVQCSPGISGLGFIVDKQTIKELDLDKDPDNGFYVTHDPDQNRVLFITSDMLKNDSLLFNQYKKVLDVESKNTLMTQISGIVMNVIQEKTFEFYKSLGFKTTKEGEHYNTTVTNDNRFSMIIDKSGSQKNIFCAIFETPDIFYTTSYFVSKNIALKTFESDCESLAFGELNHKIWGYNCLAFGNTNSYSIENFADSPLPNLDIIFRMRKQFLHISEDTLEQHYV